ncbi:hypothetical protein ACP70R_036193 [Stipagrostis hirtigluma subsp. patula]
MASKSGELRVALLCLALVGLLLLSHHAAPADAYGDAPAPASPRGKRKNSFSFNNAGGRQLTSFSMNRDSEEKKGEEAAGGEQ